MKKYIIALLPLALAGCANRPAVPTAEWSFENGHTTAEGAPAYLQTVKVYNLPDSAARVAFNMFARSMEMVDPADTLVELVPGYYAIASPKFAAAQPGDTLTFQILTAGKLRSICYTPDGFHGVSRDGYPFDMSLVRSDLLNDSTALSYVPDALEIFERNEALAAGRADVYDVVPSFKTVELLGDSTVVNLAAISFSETPQVKGTENYNVTVADGVMAVEADSAQWARLQQRLQHWFGTGERLLPTARIADGPDFPYRGVMVDMVRNFQPIEEMHRVLNLMALYGLNVLHFHVTDDEAWRLEIAALPELTAVGARRGYVAAGEETAYLPQIFAGNGNPDSTEGTANGYYTRQQMVDLLREANRLAISVIPEIESPGHARAAIVALRNNPEYRLDEPGDTSVYTSAQAFHDNVMNPALPGPYKLMETVVDELISIYAEAEAPLVTIHIGGDEVPRNAWGGSPAVQALKDSLGLEDDKAVHAHFVSRVADMIASKGLKVSGWQEVALRHPEAYNRELVPKFHSVNCWSTLGASGARVVADIAGAGFPAVLSNVQHFYLDMCYTPHPDERGLSWGGYVDEFDALHGYPANLAGSLQPIGIQGQIFAETIRSQADLEKMLLPKVLGLAERAWNADSTYTDERFNVLVAAELPKWNEAGLAYHVRQPGLKLEGNVLTVNSAYPEAEIYVSTDGTNPTRESLRLSSGESLELNPEVQQVRAIQYMGAVPSVATVLVVR